MDSTTAIILALIGNAAVFFAFIQWLLPWWTQKRRSAVALGLQRVSEMYRTMTASLERGVDRCILFAAHNSGGLPRIGAPLYATALHWVIRTKDNRVLQRYDRVGVDAFYVQMLLELYARGYYRFTTAAHKPCQLRDIYEMEGVTDSALFYIGIRDNQFLYISFSKYEGAFTEKEIIFLRLEVDHIIANLTP